MNDSSVPRILAADDSPVYRKLIERSLCTQRCGLLFANNGREAIELFAEHNPAVLITDWTMPDLSGVELCQRVRGNCREQYPYIILLTGNSEKEHVIEGLSAGADDYLTKPFHPGELQARVRVGLRIADLHHQLLQKNHELQEMALTDALTGLPNRRAVDAWVKHQVSAAARHKFPLWVVIADLDHFKKINDTYGHEVGDTVLKAFAEIVRLNTRQSNMCGRLGGEEFIAIITHVEDQENIMIPLERIRTQFENTSFTSRNRQFQCTASFGIAGASGMGTSCFDQLLSRADQALYESKHRGRNCITFSKD